MSVDFHVVIPARLQSTRLPGKVLMQVGGITILERVYRQALAARPKSVVIATDNEAVFDVAQSFGATVLMTDENHQTGTDRIAEVIQNLAYPADAIIVNVQGDEPFIPPELIHQAAALLDNQTAPMSTLCWPIKDLEEAQNPNVVKVVRDKNNHALYFSRSRIPFDRSNPQSIENLYRHVGLYAYRSQFLLEYISLPKSHLEESELLEQLRVLWAGYKIVVDVASVAPKQDINTPEDLIKIQSLFKDTEAYFPSIISTGT